MKVVMSHSSGTSSFTGQKITAGLPDECELPHKYFWLFQSACWGEGVSSPLNPARLLAGFFIPEVQQ